MKNHTETPWDVRQATNGDHDIHNSKHEYIGHACRKADSEHIVTCVNIHDELVAQVESYKRYVKDHLPGDNDLAEWILGSLDELLKKAKS